VSIFCEKYLVSSLVVPLHDPTRLTSVANPRHTRCGCSSQPYCWSARSSIAIALPVIGEHSQQAVHQHISSPDVKYPKPFSAQALPSLLPRAGVVPLSPKPKSPTDVDPAPPKPLGNDNPDPAGPPPHLAPGKPPASNANLKPWEGPVPSELEISALCNVPKDKAFSTRGHGPKPTSTVAKLGLLWTSRLTRTSTSICSVGGMERLGMRRSGSCSPVASRACTLPKPAAKCVLWCHGRRGLIPRDSSTMMSGLS